MHACVISSQILYGVGGENRVPYVMILTDLSCFHNFLHTNIDVVDPINLKPSSAVPAYFHVRINGY